MASMRVVHHEQHDSGRCRAPDSPGQRGPFAWAETSCDRGGSGVRRAGSLAKARRHFRRRRPHSCRESAGALMRTVRHRGQCSDERNVGRARIGHAWSSKSFHNNVTWCSPSAANKACGSTSCAIIERPRQEPAYRRGKYPAGPRSPVRQSLRAQGYRSDPCARVRRRQAPHACHPAVRYFPCAARIARGSRGSIARAAAGDRGTQGPNVYATAAFGRAPPRHVCDQSEEGAWTTVLAASGSRALRRPGGTGSRRRSNRERP